MVQVMKMGFMVDISTNHQQTTCKLFTGMLRPLGVVLGEPRFPPSRIEPPQHGKLTGKNSKLSPFQP